ncbi:MAG: peptidoglycan bridge formation glycyltransferase FemA/FemB family protein [Patescibacteria group bacterium]|nr:peptidoglycan bridge formation glycyltransferase FemA/FemB family protein [Patescibacteria group bacterium]
MFIDRKNKIPPHIVQSPAWGEVKTMLGTKSVRTKNGVQFTLHKIPMLNKNFGFCPKVSPSEIDWNDIKKLGKDNNCVCIRFDTPNSAKGQFSEKFKKYCVKAPKNTFAQKTLFLDLTKSEETLLKEMHSKTRYNIRLAPKKEVVVKEANKEKLPIFLKLQKETAKRQGFYIHNDHYFKTVFEELSKRDMAKLLIAYKEDTPLTAWLLFVYKEVIYYVYGGSSEEYKNLMPSNLMAWEAIKLGKSLNCKYFDMWGIADNPENSKDPWYGFTKFKLGFGGNIVEFEDSWDLVLEPLPYKLFNMAEKIRWVLLKFKK